MAYAAKDFERRIFITGGVRNYDSTYFSLCVLCIQTSLSKMATCTRRGGYDYDFVITPPKSLESPVCLMTFRDPHVISCCGNEFCQLCIERVQRDGKPCPLCNELNFTTFLHKKLVREVNGLVVRCPQKELGCEWEGELGQVEQHLNPGAGLSSSSGCGYICGGGMLFSLWCTSTTTNGWRTRDGKLSKATNRNAGC